LNFADQAGGLGARRGLSFRGSRVR